MWQCRMLPTSAKLTQGWQQSTGSQHSLRCPYRISGTAELRITSHHSPEFAPHDSASNNSVAHSLLIQQHVARRQLPHWVHPHCCWLQCPATWDVHRVNTVAIDRSDSHHQGNISSARTMKARCSMSMAWLAAGKECAVFTHRQKACKPMLTAIVSNNAALIWTC